MMLTSHMLEMLATPFLGFLSFEQQLKAYDKGRAYMHDDLKRIQTPMHDPPKELGRRLWRLHFRSPLMNAAGLDKYCEFYWTMALLGAGSHIVGTTTKSPRQGFLYQGVRAPWLPLRASGAALNKMGLPNVGHEQMAYRTKKVAKLTNMPLWASVAADPDASPQDKPRGVLDGIRGYVKNNIDVIEVNESCPNTGEAAVTLGGLEDRLRDYSTLCFAAPLIIKLSNDTDVKQVPKIMQLLVRYRFAGVNFGNTSTQYAKMRPEIAPKDRKMYDAFTGNKEIGGGLSGRPLKDESLALCSIARDELDHLKPNHEFHIIRTGGIENAKDVKESLQVASLCQWYTGFYAALRKQGTDVYSELYKELLR